MILAIASGKGGTGKTTVAVNLARVLGEPVQLLDCDVEEPNAHLFLRGSVSPEETVEIPIPEVDESLCNACGECGRICQYHAIVQLKGPPLVLPELCHGCCGCARVCATKAIREAGRRIGVVSSLAAGPITLIQGRLDVGVAMVRVLGLPIGVVVNRVGVGDGRVHEYCLAQDIPILLEIPDDRRIAEAYSRGMLIVEALPEYRGHVDVDAPARRVLNQEDVEAPPHEPGLLPAWLAQRGVTVVLAGGMGRRAQDLFAQQGIVVVVGVPSETPKRLVAQYLAGTLRAGDNICDH